MRLEEKIDAFVKEMELALLIFKKEVQENEFAKGWNYVETRPGGDIYRWLALDPTKEDGWVPCAACVHLSGDHHWYTGRPIASVSSVVSHRPATEEEIKEALSKVAEKMGIVAGAKIKRLDQWGFSPPTVCINHNSVLYYGGEEDSLHIGCREVYRKGQWAEVIKNEPKEIEVADVKVLFTPSGFAKIGNDRTYLLSKSDIETILKNFPC